MARRGCRRCRKPGLRWLGDKKPFQHTDPRLLPLNPGKFFPDALFLHIIRHPCAVTASSDDFNRHNGDFWIGLSPEEKIRRWTHHEKLVADLKLRLGDRIHSLRYEDFCRRTERELAGVFRFLGVTPDAGVLQRPPPRQAVPPPPPPPENQLPVGDITAGRPARATTRKSQPAGCAPRWVSTGIGSWPNACTKPCTPKFSRRSRKSAALSRAARCWKSRATPDASHLAEPPGPGGRAGKIGLNLAGAGYTDFPSLRATPTPMTCFPDHRFSMRCCATRPWNMTSFFGNRSPKSAASPSPAVRSSSAHRVMA